MAKNRGKVTFSRREKLMCLGLGALAPVVMALLAIGLTLMGSDLVDVGGKLNAALQTVALTRRAQSEKYNNENLQAINAVKDKIAVVCVDDETLRDERFNEWPIPRTRYVELIKFMEKAQATALGIDVLFMEHQKAYPGADAALAKALHESKLPIIVDTVQRGASGNLEYHEPLPMLTEGWSHDEKLGKLGVTYEADESIQSVPLVVPVNGEDRYSFDALLAARALGEPLNAIRDRSGEGFGWAYVDIGKTKVPVVDGAVQINYFWPGSMQQAEVKANTFGDANSAKLSLNYYPLSALWDMNEDDLKTFFKDRIVLVGVTAQAGQDIKKTPIGKMAGVEVHAFALLTILSGLFTTITPVHWVFVASLAFCLFLGFLLPRLDPRIGALLTIAMLVLIVIGSYLLLARRNLWFPPALPLFSVSLGFALVTFYLVRAERRAKLLMKTLFEKATPVREEDVIKFLLSGKTQADEFETELEVRERTVLFSDIRDYTVMSESMNAETVMKTLNVYYSEMQTVINECGGKIWEYVGDAQMVIFGEKNNGRYPPECQVKPEYANMNPSDQAVHAAINMIARLEQLNAEASPKGQPVLDIGIGINSGPVSLGTIKNKGKLVFAAIGDTTNVAARMQAMSKDLKCRILLSQSTFDQCEDIYLSEKVENVKVKGKAEPMTVYRVFAGQQARERENVTTNA